MQTIVLVIHVLAAVAIITLILLQQGKGATVGASFGAGASQTIFGSQGSGNFFSRLTAIIATVFFLTSFGLAYLAKERASVIDVGIPAIEQPVNEIPAVEDTEESAVPEVPAVEDSTPAEVPSAPTTNETEQDVPAVPQN